MNLRTIGGNPSGIPGRLAGRLMNALHAGLYKQIIREICEVEGNRSITILDIGCGGGVAIRHFSGFLKEARVFGIDISADMVCLAGRLNRKAIADGRVRIIKGDVGKIAIEDKTVNIVTIFDCINFWSDYHEAFSEIKRVLTDDGKLFIVNAYPETGTKWHEFVKFKDTDDYRILLENHGFVLRSHRMNGHTIILEGRPEKSPDFRR